MGVCGTCGVELAVGDWPFCPHGTGRSAAIGDDIPGGLVMDHLEPGRKVYSKSELKRVLASHGYQLTDRRAEGGRCPDQHLSRWV